MNYIKLSWLVAGLCLAMAAAACNNAPTTSPSAVPVAEPQTVEQMEEQRQQINKEEEQFLNMLKYTGNRGRIRDGEDE